MITSTFRWRQHATHSLSYSDLCFSHYLLLYSAADENLNLTASLPKTSRLFSFFPPIADLCCLLSSPSSLMLRTCSGYLGCGLHYGRNGSPQNPFPGKGLYPWAVFWLLRQKAGAQASRRPALSSLNGPRRDGRRSSQPEMSYLWLSRTNHLPFHTNSLTWLSWPELQAAAGAARAEASHAKLGTVNVCSATSEHRSSPTAPDSMSLIDYAEDKYLARCWQSSEIIEEWRTASFLAVDFTVTRLFEDFAIETEWCSCPEAEVTQLHAGHFFSHASNTRHPAPHHAPPPHLPLYLCFIETFLSIILLLLFLFVFFQSCMLICWLSLHFFSWCLVCWLHHGRNGPG